MSIQPVMETYTVQDYLQWEGDWELINGQPVAMAPSPGLTHQTLSMTIARQLDESLDDCPRCQALFEIDVEFSDYTVVRPDVLVICYQPEGERLNRAPALIFEVISPNGQGKDFATNDENGLARFPHPNPLPEGEGSIKSLREIRIDDTRHNEVVKFELYRSEGVACYVLIYPDSKKAKVYTLIEGEYRKAGDFHDEQYRFELPGCAIDFDFSRIWKRKGAAV